MLLQAYIYNLYMYVYKDGRSLNMECSQWREKHSCEKKKKNGVHKQQADDQREFASLGEKKRQQPAADKAQYLFATRIPWKKPQKWRNTVIKYDDSFCYSVQSCPFLRAQNLKNKCSSGKAEAVVENSGMFAHTCSSMLTIFTWL